MSRPDLELPEGWNKAAQEAWEDFCVVEWEFKPEHEYAYKVGFWHGAIWYKNHSMETKDPDGTKS
jgi:hypothetical protein